MPLRNADRPAVTAALKKFRRVVFDTPVGINNPEARAYNSTLVAAVERLAKALHPSASHGRTDLKPSPEGLLRCPPFLLDNGNKDLHDPASDLPPEVAQVWREVWNKLEALCNAEEIPLTVESRDGWLVLLDGALKLSRSRVAPRGQPGRRGYPIAAWKYAIRLRQEHPEWKAATLRKECLKRFAEDDVPASNEAFRRWMTRPRKNWAK
jgi:hypothetical protein